MATPYQVSIKTSVKARGIGVHTGRTITMTLHPAPANTGIVFLRYVDGQRHEIPALVQYVGSTQWSTCLINEAGVRALTVEHLMAALFGMGVDNLYVELTDDEVPIMDGSAISFVFLLESAGFLVSTEHLKKYYRVNQPVRYQDGDRYAQIMPDKSFSLSLDIVFQQSLYEKENQSASFDFSASTFMQHIARARTFGDYRDLEKMEALNLAKGSSLDNTTVFKDKEVLNYEGLRFPNECVRHKILDAIGDLSLLGYPMLGAFSGHQSGHEINNQLLKKFLADPQSWTLVEASKDQSFPIDFPEVG
jgi:UDP-3-O-[3-hydroxymyristoyl] N-acetylglucosamine deacetylase